MKQKLFFLMTTIIMAAMVLTACGTKNNNPTTPIAPTTPSISIAPSASVAPVVETGKTEEVTVTAKNFAFDKTVIHVKKGDKIKLTLVNGSGYHGLDIPDLGISLKQPGTAEFIADKVGEFKYICSVMCGTGHDVMVGKLIIE